MGFIEPTAFKWATDSGSKRRKQPVRGTRWKARYRDGDGRARSRSFATKTEAQDFLARTSAGMQRGDYIDPIERRRHFSDWASIWWDTTVKLRPTTRRGYWQRLHGHVLPYFGPRAMGGIDYVDIEKFIAAKIAQGLSPKKVRDAVSVVSLVMKCAVRSNARKDNPAAGHQIRVARRKLRPGDVPDMGDIERLVAQVRDPYKPAVWLMAFTGLRPSELCGLRVGSIDFTRRLVRVSETLLPVHSFGGSRYALVNGPPKTDAGDRDIPIPAWLCDDLAAMLAERSAGKPGSLRRSDYLFLRPTGLPLNLDKFRQDVIRPALRSAGLPETLRTYDIRHIHASLLIDQGANPLAVAQRMGHTDPAVTLRVYGHLFAGAQEELTERLDNLRRGSAGSPTKNDVVELARAGRSAKP
jgi:integrase